MDSLENPYNLDLSCAKSNPKRMSKSMTIKIETQIFINPKYMYVQNEILRDLIGIDYESQMEVYNG